MNYMVVYLKETGEIRYAGDAPITTVGYPLEADEALLRCAAPIATDRYYVDLTGPHLKARADYTLDALPLPCKVWIEGVEYDVTEQPTFAFSQPGTYEIVVDAGVKHLLKRFMYHADTA